MEFKFCPYCGTESVKREIGDEGLIPYCEECDKPLFDIFSSCIIVLVVNSDGQAALLKQNYISDIYFNLVSGYMKPGESAEETAVREVEEELGVKLESLDLIKTYWFDKKDMLMIGFIGRCNKSDFQLSDEVDSAKWVEVEEAIKMVHPKGSVSYALLEEYRKRTEGVN